MKNLNVKVRQLGTHPPGKLSVVGSGPTTYLRLADAGDHALLGTVEGGELRRLARSLAARVLGHRGRGTEP